MGGSFSEFTSNLCIALKNVEEKYGDNKDEMGYSLSCGIKPIYLCTGKGIKESCSEDVYR